MRTVNKRVSQNALDTSPLRSEGDLQCFDAPVRNDIFLNANLQTRPPMFEIPLPVSLEKSITEDFAPNLIANLLWQRSNSMHCEILRGSGMMLDSHEVRFSLQFSSVL